MNVFRTILAATLLGAIPRLTAAPHVCPMEGQSGSEHADCPLASGARAHHHAAGLESRGDDGMGFSQAKTTHHFQLRADGGAIEVTVRDAKDAENLGRIRAHLAHVREMFAAGDFSIPMFVHGEMPPGAATMKRRAGSIRYVYEDIPGGGRVRISTDDPDALDAIQDFLRFQITEHETGDPTAVPARG
ncbi:MAG TPA: hypothetical protein VFS34_08315 [Thermoanaerobaculia bacterium]|nr:hypothetical protein [Thermoanaerobaculia bacterium]